MKETRNFHFYSLLLYYNLILSLPLPFPASLLYPQKRADLPGTSTKHSVTKCNEIKNNPHIKTIQANPVGGQGSQEQARIRDTPTFTVRSLTKKQTIS